MPFVFLSAHLVVLSNHHRWHSCRSKIVLKNFCIAYFSCLSSDDGVKVYDGNDVQAPVIAHLCGVTYHAELWSSGASLLIEFYSSNSTGQQVYDGFEAKYHFVPAVEGADDDEEDEADEEEEEEEEHVVEEDDLAVANEDDASHRSTPLPGGGQPTISSSRTSAVPFVTTAGSDSATTESSQTTSSVTKKRPSKSL